LKTRRDRDNGEEEGEEEDEQYGRRKKLKL
jgi:hypothetical protein